MLYVGVRRITCEADGHLMFDGPGELLDAVVDRDLQSDANLVFNRYLDECDEVDGLPLLPFFMAVRATIRAHVTAQQASQTLEQASRTAGHQYDE